MSDNEHNDFSHSFTDLMTSLAIVFLIFAVAMICIIQSSRKDAAAKYSSIQKQKAQIDSAKNLLLRELKTIFNLKEKGKFLSTVDDCITIEGDSTYKVLIKFNGQTESCRNTGLFYPSKIFHLNDSEVRTTIESLSSIYAHVCNPTHSPYMDHIEILGHTDRNFSNADSTNCTMTQAGKGEGFNQMHCGNLYLSAQRARDVFLKIGQEIGRSRPDSFNCFTKMTQISGRGPFQNLTDSKVASTDRRVELIINFKQPLIGNE